MSKANRKNMYDELVTKKRYEDIDQALRDEFGEPKKPKVEKPKAEPQPKKKRRKLW